MRTEEAIQEFLDSRRARNLSQENIHWYGSKLSRFAYYCPKVIVRRVLTTKFEYDKVSLLAQRRLVMVTDCQAITLRHKFQIPLGALQDWLKPSKRKILAALETYILTRSPPVIPAGVSETRQTTLLLASTKGGLENSYAPAGSDSTQSPTAFQLPISRFWKAVKWGA